MPPSLTAATGMDALTHAIEAYVSTMANPLTDAAALKAIKMITQYLPKAVANGEYMKARDNMAYAQYLAGIANLILGMTMYYSQNCEFDNKATEQISKAKVFIRENLLKGIGPEEVADSLHMSYSWFRKLFKEYTGLSPAHYIQELKIQQAKDLLATTQRSTKEIAYYLTFDDIPYFTKVFKKYTGYTPQSYRKKFGRE